MTGRRVAPVVGSDALARAQHEVLERLVAADDLRDALARLAEVARSHLGADVAAVSQQSRRGVVRRLAVTDLELLGPAGGPGSGPPVGSLTETPVVVADATTDRRWPTWATATVRTGLRSALFVGLPWLPGPDLVLEVYGRRPEAFPAEAAAVAQALVRHAGVALQLVHQVESLRQALHTRGLIGTAQGILMERYGLTDEQAMTYLRRQSQHSHLRVRELAAALVARREIEPRGPQDGARA